MVDSFRGMRTGEGVGVGSSREATRVVRVANNSLEGTRQPDVTSCVGETALIVLNRTHRLSTVSPAALARIARNFVVSLVIYLLSLRASRQKVA